MKALRRQWLSAALLAGLLVMGAAGALFVYLADEVGEQAWLTRFDSTVAEFFITTAPRGWCTRSRRSRFLAAPPP